MNEKRYIVGLDAGNAYIKIKIEGEEIITYENIYSFRDDKYMELYYSMNGIKAANKSNISSMLDVSVTKTSSNMSYNFIFGKQAEDFRTTNEERFNKYKSDDIKLAMHSIVCIANTIVSNIPKDEWRDELNIEVLLSTGLPYSEFKIYGREEEYIKKFKGEHIINFHNPSYPIKKINININDVILNCEGDYALRQIIYEKDKIEKIKDKIVYIIDIGCYNVNFIGGIVVEDSDFKIIPELCASIRSGNGTAIDLAIEEIKIKYEDMFGIYDKITRLDITKAVKGERTIIDENINIEYFYYKKSELIGRRIGKQIIKLTNLIKNKDNIYSIYIAGGGAYNPFLIEPIKEVLEDHNINRELIEVVDDPLYKNIKGYFNSGIITFEG